MPICGIRIITFMPNKYSWHLISATLSIREPSSPPSQGHFAMLYRDAAKHPTFHKTQAPMTKNYSASNVWRHLIEKSRLKNLVIEAYTSPGIQFIPIDHLSSLTGSNGGILIHFLPLLSCMLTIYHLLILKPPNKL